MEIKYLDKPLTITKYQVYEGPIPLIYLPKNSIMRVMGKFVMDYEGKYYELLEVSYEGKTYQFGNFASLHPDIIAL